MMPSREQIEEYLNELDEWAWRTLQSAAADIPNLNAIANRIWADLGRFGPPQLPLQGLGVFDIPPNPPPPPPDPGFLVRTGGWILSHKLKALGLSVCFVVGSGLLAGYVHSRMRTTQLQNKSKATTRRKERKEVAVVLGADSALGYQLVLELESRGFIVIATVSKSDAVEEFELNGNGYVRALVLDPTDPAAIPAFIRSLQTSLSLRFPLAGSGDPYYSSPSLHPHICTVISLLTLQKPPPPTPFEHLSLSSTYLSYLQSSHMAPLQAIQNLLPLMRVPANNSASSGVGRGKKIVVCVPIIASRVGVSWNSAQAMSAGSTIKAVDVLRRELRDSGQSNNISVTVADVGFVGLSSSTYNSGASAYMTDWSPNIRSTYGAAFLGALEHSRLNPRPPDNLEDVVKKLASMVDESPSGIWSGLPISWIPRERELIGAGVYTYALASKLPEWLLDGLLSLPARLTEVRNKLVPIVLHPEEVKPVEVAEEEEEPEELDVPEEEQIPAETASYCGKGTPASSGYSSDVEVLSLHSNEHVTSSWVSLNEKQE